MSESDRIAAISARADVLFARISKATAGPKRPRIPGDGDGDGIPNEGRKPKGGAKGFAGEKMTMDAASRFFPKHADKLKALKNGESVTILTNPAKAQFSRLTRAGSGFEVEENVRPRGVAKPKTREQVQNETTDAISALAALPKGALGRASADKFGDPVYDGKNLSATGKEGVNRATGLKVREHEVVDSNGRRTGERFWVGPKNVVFPD